MVDSKSFQFLEIAQTKGKNTAFRQRQKQNLKTPYHTAQQEIAHF